MSSRFFGLFSYGKLLNWVVRISILMEIVEHLNLNIYVSGRVESVALCSVNNFLIEIVVI